MADDKNLVVKAQLLAYQLYNRDFFDIYPEASEDEELNSIINVMAEELKKLEATQEEHRYKYSLKQLWQDAFSSSIAKQEIMGELYYYAFLGQYFKENDFYLLNKEEDIRVHVCIIAPTGLGKTEANNFLHLVSSQCEFKPFILSRYNDASVIGTYHYPTHEFNKKKHLKEGDDFWESPEKYGILYNCDFFIGDEAEKVLKTTPNTEQIQQTLQAVMNRHNSPGNRVGNDLVNGSVGYYPFCSVILTSYYLSEFKETLISRGLTQRTILYVQQDDDDLRRDIQRRMIYGMQEKGDAEQTNFSEEKIKLFLDKLKALPKEKTRIYGSHQAAEKLEIYITQLRDLFDLTAGQKEIYNGMISRLIINFYKIAALNALSEGRNEIIEDDIDDAFMLLRKTVVATLEYILEHVETEVDKKMVNYYKTAKAVIGNRFYPKMELYKRLEQAWNCSGSCAINRTKRMGSMLVSKVGENGREVWGVK